MAARKKAEPPSALPIEGYSYRQLRPLVAAALRADLSVLVRGHPGIGKSSLARHVAAELGKPLLDVRLAQRDPAEVAGVFFPDRERRSLELFAPDWVKQACDAPCFVLLDEINAAVTKLHQAAAYQIVLEHRVGPFVFHPETVVMAAGNLEEDRAIVTPLSSALSNRFVHFVMRPDVESWAEWAAANRMDDRIMAFILSERNEVLYQPNGDYAFPTPRSWAMASRMLEQVDASAAKQAVAACVGKAMADRFMKHVTIHQKVRADEIILKGKLIDFTAAKHREPSFIYAAVFCVAMFVVNQSLTDTQLPNIVGFITSPGLDPEFQSLFLRQIYQRNPTVLTRLRALPAYRELAAGLVANQFGRGV